MTTSSRPPRLANWLLNLFVSKEQASPIAGDLREEFATVASRRGLSAARLWYWRQTAKTVPHLFYAQLVTEPGQTFAALVAGLVVLWLANMLMVAIAWHYYPYGWPEFLRLLVWLVCFPIATLIIPPMLSGCIAAWATKRRGPAVTILLIFAVFALRLVVMYFFPRQLPSLVPYWSLWPYAAAREIDTVAGAVGWPMMVLVGGLVARRSLPAHVR